MYNVYCNIYIMCVCVCVTVQTENDQPLSSKVIHTSFFEFRLQNMCFKSVRQELLSVCRLA